MLVSTLELLRCPFCGTTLDVVENEALVRTAERISAGVLGCQCCAFPIVAGIPVLIADDPTRDAMHALEAGHEDEALLALLGLDSDERRAAFRAFMARGDAGTYPRRPRDPEPRRRGHLLRLSLLRSHLRDDAGRCCARSAGTARPSPGHRRLRRRRATSRAICRRCRPARCTVLADVFFWKLWLARTFIAPGCEPVCCDGNSPLPFASRTFDMVVLADAFPYIWHKRMLAADLMRIAGPDGFVVMPHLHSSLDVQLLRRA